MTVKQQVQQLIADLPDDVTATEIQYHLYVRQKVERSMRAVSEGGVLTHEQVKAEMKRWLESSGGRS